MKDTFLQADDRYHVGRDFRGKGQRTDERNQKQNKIKKTTTNKTSLQNINNTSQTLIYTYSSDTIHVLFRYSSCPIHV